MHECGVERTSRWEAELRTAFQLLRGIATAAGSAHRAGRVPLLLSGNCHGTLGMLAAQSGARPGLRVGLLRLDAHGDFHVTDVVHVHVDPDVHDPSVAPANDYAVPDGLTADEVRDVVGQVAQRLPIGSATLASDDPAHDPQGRMRDVALDLLALLAERAGP